MVVEAVDRKKFLFGETEKRDELPISNVSSGSMIELAVLEEPSLVAGVRVAEVVSPHVVEAYDLRLRFGGKGPEKSNVTRYKREEINEANLSRDMPVHLLGVRVSRRLAERTLSLRWRE